MADAASGDEEPNQKIRETADAGFGSFVSRNERVKKGDGRKTICQIITNTYLGHFYANILMFPKVPLLFNLDRLHLFPRLFSISQQISYWGLVTEVLSYRHILISLHPCHGKTYFDITKLIENVKINPLSNGIQKLKSPRLPARVL